MPLPVVAIVGRPNVGKSSLFNALVGKRVSIVDPTAGVTRDRVSAICCLDDVYFELMDTGGYGIVDRDDLGEMVERQILYAIRQAALILFVVDAREDSNPLDRRTAELLRPHYSLVRLIANKVDDPRREVDLSEFSKLGFGEPFPISAIHGHGRSELMEMIAAAIDKESSGRPDEPEMKVAIVGKRNAGKSTFINVLAGEERVIVSERPGTTRDSIDVQFTIGDQTLVAIDTAGVRKKNKFADDIEFYSYTRAVNAIRRADVVLFLIDAAVPVGQVDKALAMQISNEFKPCVIVINKWDLAMGSATTGAYREYLTKILPEIDYAPVSFTSALNGDRVMATIKLASSLFAQARMRVTTGMLNQALKSALSRHAPSPKHGCKPVRIYYATQVGVEPPTIVFFVNAPNLVTQSYQRFLLNRFREMLPMGEVPMRLLFRASRGAPDYVVSGEHAAAAHHGGRDED